MIKELKEELTFIKENLLLVIFLIGTITGIFSTVICALVFKILGI